MDSMIVITLGTWCLHWWHLGHIYCISTSMWYIHNGSGAGHAAGRKQIMMMMIELDTWLMSKYWLCFEGNIHLLFSNMNESEYSCTRIWEKRTNKKEIYALNNIFTCWWKKDITLILSNKAITKMEYYLFSRTNQWL